MLKDKRQSSQDDSDEDKPSVFANTGPMITAEALWDSLDLQSSKIDRIILHEITERQLEGFEDDLSEFANDDIDEPDPAYSGIIRAEGYTINPDGGDIDAEKALLEQDWEHIYRQKSWS